VSHIFDEQTKIINDATAPIPVSSSPPMAMIIYESGADMYVCSAPIGSIATDPVWQIKYIDSSSGIVIKWCDGDSLFDNLATSLAVVELLSYS
jgi:hypothetical protein